MVTIEYGFMQEPTKDIRRNRDEVIIGYLTRDDDTFSKYAFVNDFKLEELMDTIRILIIAKTGFGKSFLIRTIFDRLNQIGIKCVFANDSKGEMKYSVDPNPDFYKQLRSELPDRIRKEVSYGTLDALGVRPQGVEDLRVYSPEWAYVEGTTPFSPKFSSLTEAMARTLLGIGTQKQAKRQNRVLKIMIDTVKKMKDQGVDTLTKEVLEELKYILPREMTKGGHSMFTEEQIIKLDEVRRVYDNLMYCLERKIVDGEHAADIIDLIVDEKGNPHNTVFDWSQVKMIERREMFGEYQAYIANIGYSVLDAMRGIGDRTIKGDVCFFGDEMQPFLGSGKGSNNLVRNMVEDIATNGRQFGMSECIAMQVSNIHKNILGNMDYIFLGPIYDDRELRKYRKIFNWIFEDSIYIGEDENGKEIKSTTSYGMKLLQTLSEHEFLAINTTLSEYSVIKAYPPLSHHITKFSSGVPA